MNFEELISNQDFMKKFDVISSYEEAKDLFAAEGVDLDAEIKNLQGAPEGELTEEALENVAGGFSLKQFWVTLGKLLNPLPPIGTYPWPRPIEIINKKTGRHG